MNSTKAPLTAPERLARMRENMERTLPRLTRGVDDWMSVAICGFGPSLGESFNDLTNSDLIMTTSGAHDYLIHRGIVPTFHVECDPREHKAKFLERSHPDVTYLINSQCHPRMFEVLKNRTVIMWHGFTDDDAENQVKLVESMEPGARLLGGGTNVGMRAIIVAREMGYKTFHLHGMDCSYSSTQWAGNHYTKPHREVIVKVEGREFRTSDLMMQSTDDFLNMLNMLSGCKFVIHGDGLLKARMNLFMKDKKKACAPGWWTPVNFRLAA